MTSGKIVAFAILAVAITEVSSWTIDLPEARKLFFSHNNKENKIQTSSSNTEINNGDTRPYDNIEPNSFHNADEYYYDKYVYDKDDKNSVNRGYADGYKHQGYMEKKVHDIVRKGSIYLDGLKRSLERYGEVLKNCSRINFNQTRNSSNSNSNRDPPSPFPTFDYTQTSDFQRSNFSTSDVPVFNYTNTNFSALNTGFSNRDSMAMCAEATKRREHIRRLTGLALWTTKRLEDNAYDAKYNKYHEQEENELLLKLSWFLDRIAHYTGFEPNVEEFVNRTTTPRPPAPSGPPFPLPFDNVPRDVIQRMMDCIKENSSEPATVRCRYPLPLPDIVQQMYERGDPRFANTRIPDPSTSVISTSNADSVPQSSSLELLVATGSAAAEFPPKPASTVTVTNVKSVHKRSIDETPLIKFMKYYGKHKVWVNSNPIDENDVKNDNFEVPNQLPVKSIQKRSLFKKHIHLKLPEKPFKALHDHLKKGAGIHYEKNQEQLKIIKGHLEKMRHTASLTVKHNLKKFDHAIKKVYKRSVHYGRKYKPRISEDPYQDLSYYSKNAKGVEYNYDPAQAALVRLGLEQIFQTGNIEVVRRYGSNFNPLDPSPFYSGFIRYSIDV